MLRLLLAIPRLMNSPSQLMHFFWLAPVSDGANQTGKWVNRRKNDGEVATDGDGRCWTVPDGDGIVGSLLYRTSIHST
jgi:hypothetical protein